MPPRSEPSVDGLAVRIDQRLGAGAERGILAAILVLALVVRVAFVLAMDANPYFAEPELDQRLFLDWGREVAVGQLAPDGPFPRAPLYAWWVGAWLKLGGGDLAVVRLAQACAGTLAVYCGWRCAREVLPRSTALLSALLHALAWIVVYYEAELLREALVPLANFAALWATLRWWKAGSPRHALVAGVLWGLAALLRPQVLLVPLAFAAARAWRARRIERAALAIVLAAFVPIAPVTLHNLRAGGELVLVSSEGGQALWIANNPAADGLSAVAPGTRRGLLEEEEDGRAEAARALGRPASPGEVSRYFAGRAWSWIVAEPGAFARLLARKAWLLAGDWEQGGNPEEPHFLAQRFAPWVLWSPVGFALLLALAAASLAARRETAAGARASTPPALGSRGALAPVHLVLGVYALTVLAFLASARHRLPLVPLLALPAAAGAMLLASRAASAWERRSPAGLVLPGLLTAGAYTLSILAPAPVEASRANGLAWLGMHAARAGDLRGARALLDESITARDDFAYVWAARAATAAGLGDTAAALADFERAVRLEPGNIQALLGLAELELRSGEFSDAAAHAARAIDLAPHLARGWAARGRARYRLGEIPGAVADLEAARARDAGSFTIAYSLAAALEEVPAREAAIQAYTAAAELILSSAEASRSRSTRRSGGAVGGAAAGSSAGADDGRVPARAPITPEARRATREALVRLLESTGRIAEAEDWRSRLADGSPAGP